MYTYKTIQKKKSANYLSIILDRNGDKIFNFGHNMWEPINVKIEINCYIITK
jgi:hypothetical protein